MGLVLCHWEEGRTVAGERKLVVPLEGMPSNRGSQGAGARGSLQQHWRVNNPFRDSWRLSHNGLVVPFLPGSILTIRQPKLSLAHAKGSHHPTARLSKLLPTFTPSGLWLPCGDRRVSCWNERMIFRVSQRCCHQKMESHSSRMGWWGRWIQI